MVNPLRVIIFAAMSKTIVYFFFILTALFPAISFAQSTQGKASFYGERFHGRKMANGNLYHSDSLFCAHRTLPFGTKLRVKNLKNGKEVIVTVQDRGPYVRGRVIDLSKIAARKLGMVSQGIAMVEINPHTPISIPYLDYDSIPRVNFVPQNKKALKLDPSSLEAYLR